MRVLAAAVDAAFVVQQLHNRSAQFEHKRNTEGLGRAIQQGTVESARGHLASSHVEAGHPAVGILAVNIAVDERHPTVVRARVCPVGGCRGSPEIPLLPDALVQMIGAEPGEQKDQGHAGEAGGHGDDLSLPLEFAGVAGARHQALFTKNLFHPDVTQEKGPVSFPGSSLGEGLDGNIEHLGEIGVERRALAHGRGKVDAAREQRPGGPLAGSEDDLEIALQARDGSGEAVREIIQRVHTVECLSVRRLVGLQVADELKAALEQALVYRRQVHADLVRVERLIDRGGIGPSEHLVLQTGVVQIVKEFPETVDQVTFCDENEDREPDIQRALDGVELLGDLCALGFDLFRRVLDQAVRGNDKDHTVDGAVGAALPDEGQEFLPFAGGPCLDVFEHQAARGIENDGIVGEPPVHVDGAAGALEIIVQAGRESDVRVANRLGFARAGLAHEHVPWHAVHVLAGSLEGVESLLEFLPKIVEACDHVRLVDALRRGGDALADLAPEPFGAFVSPLSQDHGIDRQQEDDDQDTDGQEDESAHTEQMMCDEPECAATDGGGAYLHRIGHIGETGKHRRHSLLWLALLSFSAEQGRKSRGPCGQRSGRSRRHDVAKDR